MIGRTALFAILAATALMAMPAQAQRAPEWEHCTSQQRKFTFAAIIEACTTIIGSRGLTPRDYAVAYVYRGDALLESDLLDDAVVHRAIADFNEAIKRSPDFAAAYFARSFAWARLDEHDRRIADYTQVIRLEPNHIHAYYYRGITWHTKKDYDRAIADFNAAIKINPNFGQAYNYRGLARRDKGDKAGAEADFATARKLLPGLK